jgi:nucleotide-binding universal stress UspA family protein
MATSPFSSILVGTDGSDTAAHAVDHAIKLAADVGAKLVVVSAFEPKQPEPAVPDSLDAPENVHWKLGPHEYVLAVLDRATQDAKQAGVDEVVTFERQGDAADAILDVAEEQGCDLIVVGNQGMRGAKRFLLGSVPNKISHAAPCSVLIVRTS